MGEEPAVCMAAAVCSFCAIGVYVGEEIVSGVFSFQIKLCMQLPCFLNHSNGSSVKRVPFTFQFAFLR